MGNNKNILGLAATVFILLSLSTVFALVNTASHAADRDESFLDCSSCHIGGQFKGTPMECVLCHNNSRAPGKNADHIPSSNICDDCHTENSWLGARYDHADVVGPCTNCHNNVVAPGKPPSHILTTELCEDCHNTITFTRVGRVDHVSVIGSCSSCHNGVISTGKHPGHIQTSAECDLCHNTRTWRGAGFDHSTVTQFLRQN